MPGEVVHGIHNFFPSVKVLKKYRCKFETVFNLMKKLKVTISRRCLIKNVLCALAI
jgi:hypothetical protein